jgi:DNA (cytosine-5)-methyltransferase 1
MSRRANTRSPSDRRDGHTRSSVATKVDKRRPTSVGLFAGIGGIELGLHAAGFQTVLLSEIDPAARAVLEQRFPGVELHGDIRTLEELPRVEVVAGGFPCQDLSQAGRTAGIRGRNSGLVGEVFRLLERTETEPRWLLLENVPFMLQLERGRAMDFLASSLEELGFDWAYRIVDARSFGLPQRRKRVVLVASRSDDPRTVLFADDAGELLFPRRPESACGFYWTEGLRGLGWAVDAVPTLKGGSTIGIPSPPAIWLPDGGIVVPEIRDAERLQGFEPNWTEAAMHTGRRGSALRWKLVGNAVSVPVAAWVGRHLRAPAEYDFSLDDGPPRQLDRRWPVAAYSVGGERQAVSVSEWPVHERFTPLGEFLEYPTPNLSVRATAGFLERARRSSLRFQHGFLDAVEAHLDAVSGEPDQLALAG